MQEFEDYVKSNYNILGATACAIKYTFTTRDTIEHHFLQNINNNTFIQLQVTNHLRKTKISQKIMILFMSVNHVQLNLLITRIIC